MENPCGFNIAFHRIKINESNVFLLTFVNYSDIKNDVFSRFKYIFYSSVTF